MAQYKITAMGLPGKIDIGIIRYIPKLEPLCDFIDEILRGEYFTSGCIVCDFKSSDFHQLGYAALSGIFNEELVSEAFYNLTDEGVEVFMGALKDVSDEFGHWKQVKSVEESTDEDSLGGRDATKVYREVWVLYKSLLTADPEEFIGILAELVLRYVHAVNGEALHHSFAGIVNTLENSHQHKIVDMSITFTPSYLAGPTFDLTITTEG